MNIIFPTFVFAAVLLLSSCANTQFGVSGEQWQQMTDEQKRLTIEGYNQRQLLAEQRRMEKAQSDTEVLAKKEQQRQIKIENIKNGGGTLGDIVRISILSCQAKLGSKYRTINPIAIKLVDGEQRVIKNNVQAHKYTSYSKNLPISYQDGLVTIAAEPEGMQGIYLPYEQSWIKGHRYHNLFVKGRVRLKNCEITISVVPNSSHWLRIN